MIPEGLYYSEVCPDIIERLVMISSEGSSRYYAKAPSDII